MEREKARERVNQVKKENRGFSHSVRLLKECGGWSRR